MYCLSRDGMCATESKGFGIAKEISFTRYYRDGEYKFSKHNEIMYCIYTHNNYFMDAFHTESEAKEKLKEAMYAAAREKEIFEF